MSLPERIKPMDMCRGRFNKPKPGAKPAKDGQPEFEPKLRKPPKVCLNPECNAEVAEYNSYCESCWAEMNRQTERQERLERYRDILAKSNLGPEAKTKAVSFVAGEAMVTAGLACPRAFLAVKSWEYGPVGLYLHGPVGSGKTYLAQCLLKAMAWQKPGRYSFFLDLPQLFSEMRLGINGRHITEKWLDRASRCALLVMDDLGAEAQTERAREAILPILNTRNDRGLPVIITSNKTLDDLNGYLADAEGRIASRVLSICDPVRVEKRLDGNPVDLRVELAKRRLSEGSTG